MTPGPAVRETMQVSLPQYSTVYPSPTLTSNLWEARHAAGDSVCIDFKEVNGCPSNCEIVG